METEFGSSVDAATRASRAYPGPNASQNESSAIVVQDVQIRASDTLVNETPNTDETGLITPQELEAAVQQLTDYVSSHQRDLQFTVDDETGRSVVKIVDRETGDVIRQIPSEDMMAMARSLNKLQGVLFQEQA